MIAPSVQALAELTVRIKVLELEIKTHARNKYPQSVQLEQIPGWGPITALYFVLKIEDPNRFERIRDVGAYLGLCPGRDQSAALLHLKTASSPRNMNGKHTLCFNLTLAPSHRARRHKV